MGHFRHARKALKLIPTMCHKQWTEWSE